MWSIISHIKVSPKLDRRRSEDSVQCILAISSVETLLLGADPKLDVEYGKVCCKMASGKEILLAEITHHYEKFVWSLALIRTAFGVDHS